MYPKVTKIPDFVEMERRLLALWKAERVFARRQERNRGRAAWSFIDGPITANNPMGVHHAWGRTLKDVFNRYFAMHGYEVRCQNGFDCQGLWVEVEVEKEHGFQTKRDITEFGVDNFVRECKERVLTFAAKQTEQSIRLGYWMDWNEPDGLLGLRDALRRGDETYEYEAPSGQTITDSPERIIGALGSPEVGGSYFTLSDENNYSIWGFIKKCHEDGDLYRGADVMPWCTRCGTGISQMEVVEGRRITSHTSVYVRFPVRGAPREALLVWTTTPWTLPSNVAVAVNPKMTYLKVRHGDWTYYVGKENFDAARDTTLEAEGVRERRKLPSLRQILKNLGEPPEVLEELPGERLLGLAYDAPFDDLDAAVTEGGVAPFAVGFGEGKTAAGAHAVIAWGDVSGGEGTGLVHIAPGCGAEDFRLGEEHDLPVLAPLTQDGFFVDGFGDLSGRHVLDLPQELVESLKQRGALVVREKYPHVYPHCWRCKTELVFELVHGWYIRMDWRDEIKAVVRTATWVPPDGEARELDWLTNMGDWLISKSRFWGLALPIWTCDDCDAVTVIGSRDELERRAVEGWDTFDGHAPHRPFVDEVKIRCDQCGGVATRVPDVGNPWLDAGIVTLSTLRYRTDREYWERWFPADLVLESFPGQFRNWFYALLAMSAKLTGQAPFKHLLGHALVFDERGEEMHKSKGNAIFFDQAAEKVGAEPMRFIYASQNSSANLHFPDIEKSGQRETLFAQIAGRKMMTLWNCYNFFVSYAAIERWQVPGSAMALEDRDILDRWILSRLDTMVGEANQFLSGFQVYRFMDRLERFNEDLSNWYLRRSRPRFWASDDSATKQAAFETLYEVLATVVRMIAPVLPFLSEEIHQGMCRAADPQAPDSVHLADYPEPVPGRSDHQLERQMAYAIQVKNVGLSLRNQSKIRVRQPLPRLVVRPSTAEQEATLRDPVFARMICDELNVKAIEIFDAGEVALEPSVRINFKVLGPKLDKRVQLAKAAVTALDARTLHDALLADGQVEIDLGGEPYTLLTEDVQIRYKQIGDTIAGGDGGVLAVLDAEVSEGLRLEGLARDINREAQDLRRELDLDLDQRVHVRYACGDGLAAAIEANASYLKGELLAVSLERVDVLEGKAVEVDGAPLTLHIEPVETVPA